MKLVLVTLTHTGLVVLNHVYYCGSLLKSWKVTDLDYLPVGENGPVRLIDFSSATSVLIMS